MSRDRPEAVDRRTVLKSLGVVTAGALAGCSGSSETGGETESGASGSGSSGGSDGSDGSGDSSASEATAEPQTEASTDSGSGSSSAGSDDSGSAPSFDGWFDGVANFDGTVADQTGASEVEVTVGAEGNGGNFAFDPPAVRVSSGTTVVWNWNGKGGSHNVAAEDGSFESELVAEEGHTFSHTFEETGVYRYACTPHETLGMKGAVVVE